MNRLLTILTAAAASTALAACMGGMGGAGADAGMNAGMDAGMNSGGRMANSGAGARANASGSVMVGGAAMYPNRTIVENAVNSRDHTTLVAAVQAAGLASTLNGPGPFTVFAPTNAAFDKLPPGTVQTLTQPANRSTLQKILTYHVVPGRLTAADLMTRIRAGGGRLQLRTVQGGNLTASMMGNRIMLTDEMGGTSHVTIGDVMQSNGVIHVVDTVAMPR